MKINSKFIEQEKAYRKHLENLKEQLIQETRNCFQTAKDIVDKMNIELAEYIGKRVKITCKNKSYHIDKADTHICYFEGFAVESEGIFLSIPTIRPALLKEKKDGTESKMKYHLPYYTEEIVEIELAE